MKKKLEVIGSILIVIIILAVVLYLADYILYKKTKKSILFFKDVGVIQKNETENENTTKQVDKEKTENSSNSIKTDEDIERRLESFLGAYITTELVSPKEKALKDIIKVNMDNVEYSKVMATDNGRIYVIIKTNDDKIIKNLDNYFNKNYKGYQKATLDDKYCVYLYNALNDFNLEKEYSEYVSNHD